MHGGFVDETDIRGDETAKPLRNKRLYLVTGGDVPDAELSRFGCDLLLCGAAWRGAAGCCVRLRIFRASSE